MMLKLWLKILFLLYSGGNINADPQLHTTASSKCYDYLKVTYHLSHRRAKEYCKTQHYDSLLLIKDDETEEFIKTKFLPIGKSNYWTGGSLDSSNSWIWTDGTAIEQTNRFENSSMYGSCVKFRIQDGDTFWFRDGCGRTWHFICQRQKCLRCDDKSQTDEFHILRNVHVSVHQCKRSINLEWKYDDRLSVLLQRPIKYSIKVETTGNSFYRWLNMQPRSTSVTINDMQWDVTNKATVYASVFACDKNVTRNSSVIIPIQRPPVPAYAEAGVTENGNASQRCMFIWKLTTESEQEILFNIKSFSTPVLTRNRSSRFEEANYSLHDSSVFGTKQYSYIIDISPNRNYSFKISATSCLGSSTFISASQHCISETTGAIIVLDQNRLTINNKKAEMHLPVIDEESGLISCVFIIIQRANENNKIVANLADLIALQWTASDYITIAETYRGKASYFVIGNGSQTSCRVVPNVTIRGINRPLQDDVVYNSYFISTTPNLANTTVFIATSDIVNISSPQVVTPVRSDSTARIIGGCFPVAFLMILALLGLMARKRGWHKRALKNETSHATFIANTEGANGEQEHVYENEYGYDDCVYENMQTNPMSNFENVYKTLLENSCKGFKDLFEDIVKEVALFNLPHTHHCSAENNIKNRYKNIYSFDHSQVSLNPRNGNSYINASFIDGFNQSKKFIATQGPKSTTVNDFWQMIFEKNISIIIMLTNLVEKGKEKCFKYWPFIKTQDTFGSFVVFNHEETEYNGYVKRILTVTNKSITCESTREVTQFHMVQWPDHGVPITTSNMLRLYRQVKMNVREKSRPGSKGPIVVHCSAGVGRTGTFIALDILHDQMEKTTKIDIRSCIVKMRRNRTQMVQTLNQFIYLHKMLLELHLLPDYNYSSSDQFVGRNVDEIRYEVEYNLLSRVLPVECLTTIAQQNMHKNKDQACVPYDNNRVIVGTIGHATFLPYINGSYLTELSTHGFEIIVAQLPMPGGDKYFWRMLIGLNIDILVKLQSHNAMSGGDNSQQAFDQTIASENEMYREITKKLEVPSIADFELRELQLKGWKDIDFPPPSSSMLQTIDRMIELAQVKRESKVLICCEDGCGRTGAFCAIYLAIERLKIENQIDIFRTAKDLRDMRPNMINSLNLYKYCYQVVENYIESFSLYGNYK